MARKRKGAAAQPAAAPEHGSAVERLLAAAAERDVTQDPTFTEYLQCEELQLASTILGRAAAALADRPSGAFTARTYTPMPAPPGWLPPPI